MNGIEYDEDYCLSEKEESKEIDSINNTLKTLEYEIRHITTSSYSLIIRHGQKISESMIRLYLKKGHYKVNNANLNEILSYCSDNEIMAQSSIDFIRIINEFRNEEVLKSKITYDIIKAYLDTFNYFLIWFNEFYSEEYSTRPFSIYKISNLIQGLPSDESYLNDFEEHNAKPTLSKPIMNIIEKSYQKIEEDELDSINYEMDTPLTKSANEDEKDMDYLEGTVSSKTDDYQENNISIDADNYFEIDKSEIAIEKNEFKNEIDEIKRIESHKFIIEEESESLREKLSIKNRFRKIIENMIMEHTEKLKEEIEAQNERINNIENQIKEILSNVDEINKALQLSYQGQLESIDSDEKKDILIENYTNQYVETMSPKYFAKISKETDYMSEEEELLDTLGESAWNKLSKNSKTFLVTSKVMYNDLKRVDELEDYSGVCILVTKALEEEMFKRFFTKFIDYLKGKYGKDYSKYPTALIHIGKNKRKNLLFGKNFTMGDIAYVLCYHKSSSDNADQKRNNEKVLLEYTRECIFTDKSDDEIMKLLKGYAKDIEIIRKEYRNPSAHRNLIKRDIAKKCFNMVLDEKKLLKRMLDSFDI